MASYAILANRLAAGTIDQTSSWLGLPRWGAKLGLVAASGGVSYTLLRPGPGGLFAVENARFHQITAMSLAMHDIEEKMQQLNEAIRVALLDRDDPKILRRIITQTPDSYLMDMTYREIKEGDMKKLYNLAISLRDLQEYPIQKTYQEEPSLGFAKKPRPVFNVLDGITLEDKEEAGINMLRNTFQSLRDIAERTSAIALAIRGQARTHTVEDLDGLTEKVSTAIGRNVKRFDASSRAYYKEHAPTSTEIKVEVAKRALGFFSGYSALKFLMG
jgi:hypothetical protein